MREHKVGQSVLTHIINLPDRLFENHTEKYITQDHFIASLMKFRTYVRLRDMYIWEKQSKNWLNISKIKVSQNKNSVGQRREIIRREKAHRARGRETRKEINSKAISFFPFFYNYSFSFFLYSS